MKFKLALSAGLVLVTGMGLAFAVPARSPQAAVQEEAKTKEFKDILVKLVRQDEYLDEALEILDTASGRPSQEDLAAVGVSLKAIAKNLRHVSALNKAEFAAIQPGSDLSNYTNTILSYSRKVDRKAIQVGSLVAQLAAKNKKAAMRDAVTSRKGGKKARGRQLTEVLAEQRAMDRLAADARALRGASRDLSATSKWLYIASK